MNPALSVFAMLVAVALLSSAMFMVVQSFRTPKRVWVEECAATYDYPSCYKRWDDAHPMPEGYGFRGKDGAP